MVQLRTETAYRSRAEVTDLGLRKFMLKIYNKMAVGLFITALFAYMAANIPVVAQMLYQFDSAGYIRGMTGLGWVVAFAPIGFAMFISMGIYSFQSGTLHAVFLAYSAVMGLSLSSLFFMYTGESMTRVFLITGIMFGAMSLYGYTTKRSLMGLGGFLVMGLIGLLIASLVNVFFVKSTGFDFVVSLLFVGIFIGMIAYDTQNFKDLYYQRVYSDEQMGRVSLMAALRLYLNFINLFVHLMRLVGHRRD